MYVQKNSGDPVPIGMNRCRNIKNAYYQLEINIPGDQSTYVPEDWINVPKDRTFCHKILFCQETSVKCV